MSYPNLRAAAVALWLAVFSFPLSAAEDKLELSKTEQAILDMTNEARKKEDLPPLKMNRQLLEAARAHSSNMAQKEEMKHELDGKGPTDRVKASGYRPGYVGENIALSKGQTIEEVFDGWMQSEKHRDNILSDKFTEIGIGVRHNDKGETYYTQVFASPRR